MPPVPAPPDDHGALPRGDGGVGVDGRAATGRRNREAILEAVTARISEQGYFDFSVREVAERAGVSTRTVYNHFPNRAAMLDAVESWLEERWTREGGASLPTDLATLPDLARVNYRLFSRYRDLLVAMLRLEGQAGPMAQEAGRRRGEAMRRVVREGLPDLPPGDAEALGALLRRLGSSRTWRALHVDDGLAGEDTARVVSWAMRVLIDAAAAGDLPLADTGEEDPS